MTETTVGVVTTTSGYQGRGESRSQIDGYPDHRMRWRAAYEQARHVWESGNIPEMFA